MLKIVTELGKYPNTFADFRKYIATTHKLKESAFDDAPNAVAIPHLIAFLEHYTDLSFLDALIYTEMNLKHEKFGHNELVKKTIKVIFYKLEHNQKIDMVPF